MLKPMPLPARARSTASARASRWLAAVVAVCALAAAVPGAAQARPLITGLTGPDHYEPLALDQVKAAGVKLLRVSVPWEGVAPSEEPESWEPANPADPNYSWTSLDATVTGAVEKGLTPVLAIEGAPSWAQRPCHPAVAGRLCAPGATALAEFATAAATRYSGQFEGLPWVRYWQGLNEPNLSLYFNPQFEHGKVVSAKLYRKLINPFYDAVKSVNSRNLVLAAGLGPIEVKGLTVGPMRFARALLCMTGGKKPRPTKGNCEGGVHFDIFDIHPYTTGGPRREGRRNDVELGDLGKLRTLIRAADRAGRIKGSSRHTQIWATEFSWDTKPPDPGGLPMRIATRWTAEALHQAWLAGVTRFFWFSLRDFPREGKKPSEVIESGLYFRGATIAKDKPKKIMYAFRFPFVAYSVKGGLTFWGRTPTSSRGRVVIEALEGGRWRRIATKHANGAGIFMGRIKTGYGKGERGQVRAKYRGETAPVFSLKPVKEFYQPPFGKK